MSSSALLSVDGVGHELLRDVDTPLWDYVRASGLRVLVLGTSKDPNAKVTILLLERGSGRPVLAVKAPTTEIAARAVATEAAVLDELARLPLDGVDETIPRIVATVEFEERPALVTTAVPGTPLTTSYIGWRHTSRADRVAADFAAADGWLTRLQSATAGAPAPLDMGAGVVARLRERFAASEALERDVDRLVQIHGRLARARTPRTVVHGDLWFGNMLLDGGRVSGVVDWEGGSTTGEPVRDLVRFALMYALFLDRRTRHGRRVSGHTGLRAGRFGAGVEYALDGAGWFPGLFRQFLSDGLVRLGAPASSWRDAALAGVAEVAAFTDDDAFAEGHLQLFHTLAAKPIRGAR